MRGVQAGYASPVTDGQRIYVVDNGGILFAHDAKTGKQLWEQNLGTIQKSSPVLADGKLYVGTENGKFFIIRPHADKAEILDQDWLGSEQNPEPIIASPAVARGRVYVVSMDAIYAIGPKMAPAGAPANPATAREARRAAHLPAGVPAALLVTPTELILKPGEAIALTARAFDASGAADRTAGPGDLDGREPEGHGRRRQVHADAAAGAQAGMVKATVGAIVGAARIRVIPDLPWTFDFEDGREVPPPHWVNATGKFAVRDLDGSKVLVKLAENPFAFAKRCRPFFGSPELSDYTIESDVRAMERRRQMGDIGIVAQRYELVLFGNHQRARAAAVAAGDAAHGAESPFKCDKDTWYTMKLEVQTIGGGKVRARGKVWPKGQPEPAGVDDRAHRSDRQPQGSARASTPTRPRMPAAARSCTTTTSRSTRTSNGFAGSGFAIAIRELEPRDTNHIMSKISASAAAAVGLVSVSSLALIARSDPGKGDWPMWGGTPDRNMVSSMKGLPTSWDIKTKKNVKWVAELGSQAYGNPVVANGVVLVGTNNEAMKDPNIKGDKGVLMAFRESDGQFLWQAVHDKLAAGPRQRLAVPGHLLVAARRERHRLLRLEPRRGDGGRHRRLPRQGRTTARSRTRSSTRETDVDVIWRYDMMEELGVLQHNMANSSPVDATRT